MELWIGIIGFIVVIAVISAFVEIKKGKRLGVILPRDGFARLHKKPPLTATEIDFYYDLVSALPDFIVLSQVSFSRFLKTRGGNKKENNTRFARVSQKVVDHLICTKGFDIVAAVELDDKSHNKEKDRIRDAFLKEAGIEMIRWNVKNMPSKFEIQEAITEIQ